MLASNIRRHLALIPVLSLCFLTSVTAADPTSRPDSPGRYSPTSAPEQKTTVTPLFQPADFSGWEFIAASKTATDINQICRIESGGVIVCAGKPTGYLVLSTAPDKDYHLHAEWRLTPPSLTLNGGILLHINPPPQANSPWPQNFQVQCKNKSVGDLLPMSGATFAEPVGNPGAPNLIRAHVAADNERPLGEWNRVDVLCKGDTIEVYINDVLQNAVTQCVPRSGKIGFQFEGQSFELRNVTLETVAGQVP